MILPYGICRHIRRAQGHLGTQKSHFHENVEVLPRMRPANSGDNNSKRRALPLNNHFTYRFHAKLGFQAWEPYVKNKVCIALRHFNTNHRSQYKPTFSLRRFRFNAHLLRLPFELWSLGDIVINIIIMKGEAILHLPWPRAPQLSLPLRS